MLVPFTESSTSLLVMVTSTSVFYKTLPFLSHSMAALKERFVKCEFFHLSSVCLAVQSDVIVIGAGSAGLSAAHHLRNFGYKV